MGRPTKLTDEVQQRVVSALRAGQRLDVAASHAGVAAATVREWVARGRGTDGRRHTARYAAFAEAVERAPASAEMRAVATVLKAGESTLQACAWWLERTRPEHYGRRARVEHSGPEGGPITVYDPARVRESPTIADAARDYLATLGAEAAAERAAGSPPPSDE